MKNRTLTIIASSALAVALAVGPTAAFAKSDASLHGRAKAPASTTTSASCARAYGHLVAPGWKKMHGTTSVSTSCKLPAGIAKQLGLGPTPGTTTPDTIAPVMSLISSSTDTTSATVTWFTNENATTQLAFGTTTAYGATTTLNTNLGLFHSVTLSGLTASTLYHFHVMSRDASGNLSVSADQSFTTGTAGDTTSPVLSAIGVTGIGSTTAQVNWTTNEPATGKVYFAAGSTLNLNTASTISSPSLLTSHSLTLGGLAASTTYSYAVQSQDAFGNTSTSATSSFVTM